jgi:hypothetical protein
MKNESNNTFYKFFTNQANVSNCLAIISSSGLITAYNCNKKSLNYICQKRKQEIITCIIYMHYIFLSKF